MLEAAIQKVLIEENIVGGFFREPVEFVVQEAKEHQLYLGIDLLWCLWFVSPRTISLIPSMLQVYLKAKITLPTLRKLSSFYPSWCHR